MDAASWLVAVAVLPVWLAPPVLLLWTVTWSRGVRIGFGAVLAVALILLYAVLLGWFAGGPMWVEAAFAWGPVTVAICGAAWWADRVRSRRTPPGPEDPTVAAVRRVGGRQLAAAFAAWSICCGAGLFTPAAQFLDLRLHSPSPELVLPLPEELTLLSTERSCGSEECSQVYLVGSPDGADSDELAERLWTHLVNSKGWQRLRDDAGCRQHGWLLRHQFCGIIRDEPDQPVLRFLVSGAVAVTPAAARAGPSGGVGMVGPW